MADLRQISFFAEAEYSSVFIKKTSVFRVFFKLLFRREARGQGRKARSEDPERFARVGDGEDLWSDGRGGEAPASLRGESEVFAGD